MRRVAWLPLTVLLTHCAGRADDAPVVIGAPPAPPIQFEELPTEQRGLKVRLFEADPANASLAPREAADTRALDQAAIDALLERVDPLEEADGDRQTFALRPGSKPPPLQGSDVQETFPPDTSSAKPTVAAAPPKVIRWMPEGLVPMAPHVSITFDQPMVAVTSQQEAARSVPATLTPQPPGSWRWLGTKTLLFDPDPRLPMATEFTVEVPVGTKSANGVASTEAHRFTFATPPPVLQSSIPYDGPHGLDPVIVLAFDQAVRPAEVLAATTLRAQDAPALKLATADAVAADATAKAVTAGLEAGRWVALQPVEPLPRNTHFTVDIAAGLASAEGPRETPSAQQSYFYTYAPLAIAEHHCWWQEPCPPTSPWTVRFNNPLEAAAHDPKSWTVDPPVPGFSAQLQGDAVQLSGAFVGRTTYTVTVPAATTDRFGQTLGKAATVVFQVGPADPTLTSPGGTMLVLDPAGGSKLSVFSTNHAALKVTVHEVDPSLWGAWTRWVESLWYDDNKPRPLPGRRLMTTVVRPKGERDHNVETAVDLSAHTRNGSGQFVVLVEPTVQPRDRWNRQYVYKWVQVTEMGLTAFVDGDELVGWASALATGASLEGVDLQIAPDAVTGRTGADGLATLALGDGTRGNQVLVARRGTDLAMLPSSESSYNGSSWVRTDQLDQLRWYVADDRGLYKPGEDVRVKGWLRRYEHGPEGDITASQTTGKIHWTLTGSRGNELGTGVVDLSGLGGFEIDLKLPPDANLGTANLSITASGSFTEVGLNTSHPIQIQEFRRPEFEVTASAPTGPHVLGQQATIDLTAAYYAGGGLPNADVTWNVYAETASYVPPGWTEWSFGTWSAWWMDRGQGNNSGHVGALTGKTDPRGEHHLGVHFVAMNPPRPMTVRAEGTVFDVNRQAWTATASTLLHPSDRYVGLKTGSAFVEKGDPVDVQVVVVDLDGKAAADTAAELTFARLEWGPTKNGNWEEQALDAQTCAAVSTSDGTTTCSFATVRGGSYRVLARVVDHEGRANESELRVWVSGAEVTPSRNVELEALTLVPEQQELAPGDTARILVQAPFVPAEGTLTVRRSGLERVVRFRMDEPTTTLEIPITDAHVPNLEVQVNLIGAAKRLDDDGKPRDDLPRRVAHAAGSIAFPVSTQRRALTVKVAAAEAEVSPGATTALTLTVTDADGEPIAGAEVAVVVADESVLALTGYALPDPMTLFYAARPSGVNDHHLRTYVALSDPDALGTVGGVLGGSVGGLGGLGAPGTGYGGGGDDGLFRAAATLDATTAMPVLAEPMAERASLEKKAEEQRPDASSRGPVGQAPAAPARKNGSSKAAPTIAMRTDFSALALFAPDVRTDAAGAATVPLTVPDSVTRYRIMVVAVDASNRFGSADGAVTARLPLMVRPSPPRFLNFGDQMELPIVVQNQTDAAVDVELAVRGTNVRFVDAIGPSMPDAPDIGVSTAGRRVRIPARDRVEVRFPAATIQAGTARFQAVGATSTASDAANFTFPVWTPATTEAFATYGQIDDGGIVQPVQAPPGTWPQFGGLEVTTSSTQLQALTDAIVYLQSYPFECNEQLASRVLAIASLRDVLTAFEAPDLPPAAELEAQVESDLGRLATRQHWNGGWSFWRKGDPTWPFLSIHVANAYARSKAKGYEVPEDSFRSAQSHLENIESYIPHWYSLESRRFLRAYAIDVLRRMGAPQPAKAKALYAEAGNKLGIDALAFLLPTLHDAKATADVDAILRYIGNNVTESAGTAHFVTSYADGAQVLLHSDRRADGIVLEALMESRRDDELIAKTVRGLLAHKTKGRWGSTQENAFVLMALDRYFRVYEKETPDFVARVWLGDGYAGDHTFKGRTTERSHLEIPMGLLTETQGAQPLTIVKDGDDGRLYYRIGLKYAPKDLRLEPADYGFAVERKYVAVHDPNDVRRDKDGVWHIRAGAEIRVELSMATPMRRYHVALVDPLPAGLEAQNPALATTGTLPDAPAEDQPRWWWWSRTWYEHENLRDERVEAFTSLLWDGVHEYDYVARATTPGRFVVPPTRAEEMYMPETFGRGSTDIVIVE